MHEFHMASRTFNGYYELNAIRPIGMPSVKVEHVPIQATSLGAVPWSRWDAGRVLVKDGVAQFTDVDSVKAFMAPHVKGTIFAQVVDTLEWPHDAVFKLSYQTKSWPCGWTKHTAFFKEPAEVIEYIAHLRDWTLSEDNYFEVDLIELWDLGPEVINESKLQSL